MNSEFPYPYVTVGGLIFSEDGDILLIDSPKWIDCLTLPGGKVEKGETLVNAFTREIKEETGLDIIDIQYALVQESIFSNQFYKPNHFVMHDFIAKIAPAFNKMDVVLNEEGNSYTWIRPKEAYKMKLNKETYTLLDWYFSQVKK